MAVKAMNRGVKVYRLNIGQPDVPTPPAAMEALHRIDRKVLEYSPSDGLLSLREKMCGYYAALALMSVSTILSSLQAAPKPSSSASCRASTPVMKL